MNDVFGEACNAFYYENIREPLYTQTSISEEEPFEVSYLFRTFEQMPTIEKEALNQATGHILDIGCGVGSHVLALQSFEKNVTGIEISTGMVRIAKERGCKQIINQSITEHVGCSYDTLLLLMNGIGLAGDEENIPSFLRHLTSLLTPNGQIILDSSDLVYMYPEEDLQELETYYGNILFSMRYSKGKPTVFPWVYIDFPRLQAICSSLNLTCTKLLDGNHYDYLARITKNNP